MYLCVYMYAYMYTCISICMHVYLYRCVCVHTCVCMCIYVYIYMYKQILCGTLQSFDLVLHFVVPQFYGEWFVDLKYESLLKSNSQDLPRHPQKGPVFWCSSNTHPVVIQRWLLPAGVDNSGRQEIEITSSGFWFEWQQPVAGDLVKLLIWAYVINRRALAPTSKQMVCSFGIFLRVLRLPQPCLAPAVTCTSGSGSCVRFNPRRLGERLVRFHVRVHTAVIFFLPFAHISVHLENSPLSIWLRCSAFLPFTKTVFFLLNTLKGINKIILRKKIKPIITVTLEQIKEKISC